MFAHPRDREPRPGLDRGRRRSARRLQPTGLAEPTRISHARLTESLPPVSAVVSVPTSLPLTLRGRTARTHERNDRSRAGLDHGPHRGGAPCRYRHGGLEQGIERLRGHTRTHPSSAPTGVLRRTINGAMVRRGLLGPPNCSPGANLSGPRSPAARSTIAKAASPLKAERQGETNDSPWS